MDVTWVRVLKNRGRGLGSISHRIASLLSFCFLLHLGPSLSSKRYFARGGLSILYSRENPSPRFSKILSDYFYVISICYCDIEYSGCEGYFFSLWLCRRYVAYWFARLIAILFIVLLKKFLVAKAYISHISCTNFELSFSCKSKRYFHLRSR